ncbi:hypothetical protein N9R04_07215 [Staphylococcus sp. SQ8-PEA]|uniref:Phage protein n=1 Tax=Staphylococcus marylandisciuri TaxID=2981529 RepID=A0ABT2QRD0_9STAP|nr:hypothetical protein [Staphylococcus marylandisciuri]MCU5746507.1 hypothetical protein [Staphylococcus marylandisciuri]
MNDVVKSMDVNVWWSLFILIGLYGVKEIVRYILDARKSIKNIESEMQYKYAEKLLDQKIPIYVEHYSYLKKAIGIYQHIANYYQEFEKWNDAVYSNIVNDKQYAIEDKDEAYRNILGYRFCENLSNYIAKFEDMKIKSINVFSLNQLFIDENLISKSLTINTKIDKKLEELVAIELNIEKQRNLSDEEFTIYYKKQFLMLKYQDFIEEVERYLEEVKIEFYNEYNIELQNDYVKGNKRV